jgi:hypothetical protein
VGHVVRRVLALLVAQGAARPVGELVALFQSQSQHPFDERDERRRRHTEEPRGELGVEKSRRRRPARPLEDFEILVGGVDDGEPRTGEHLGERRDVDGERVDEGDPAGPGDLEEGETREVGPLPVELRVEGVLADALELVDEGAQRGGVGHMAELEPGGPGYPLCRSMRRGHPAQPP